MDARWTKENLQLILKRCFVLLRKYDWIVNSFMLDFYIDDHWSKLPKSWQTAFDVIQPENLSDLIENRKEMSESCLWPLELLSLKCVLKSLVLPRELRGSDDGAATSSSLPMHMQEHMSHPKVRNIFTKHIKPKKRHEIWQMANKCCQNARECGTDLIVDFGAGLGHLARLIACGYGLKVCCLEMQSTLNEQAKIIDEQFEITLQKNKSSMKWIGGHSAPIHMTWKLTDDVSPKKFVQCIRTAFGLNENEEFSFGIVGLHPCGDLAAILMRLFLMCKEAKFLNLIGCCYMKLTTGCNNPLQRGYPLSEFLTQLDGVDTMLSYESLEISCHAIEVYSNRLKCGNYDNLKVHSYRAALERIIVKTNPKFKHCGLRSIKHTPSLTFPEYSRKALRHLHIEISDIELSSSKTANDLSKWKRVVIFYTLRLLFAPLIESIVLYDRLLFLLENGCKSSIEVIFDPILSPRNHITIAVK